jgi:hypothetical protein
LYAVSTKEDGGFNDGPLGSKVYESTQATVVAVNTNVFS